jgi:hypothetical protein
MFLIYIFCPITSVKNALHDKVISVSPLRTHPNRVLQSFGHGFGLNLLTRLQIVGHDVMRMFRGSHLSTESEWTACWWV